MASFASPVGILTMEERREFNIARNNDFLKNLFGLGAGENSTDAQPIADHEEVADEAALTTQESTKARDREILSIKNAIRADFPSRELETEQIFGYLSDELQAAPALQLYGPSGSGKTSLCSTLLTRLDHPHTIIPCAGFTNARQFYVALWAQLQADIRECRTHFNAKYNTSIHLRTSAETKTPHKFADFALFLGRLVYNLYDSTPLPQHAEHQCYYVVLDGIEHLSALEAKLGVNMLQLSRHSHNRLKVISLSHHLFPTPHPCLVVHFAAYSEKQLIAIVHKLFQAELASFRAKFSADALLESVIQCFVPSYTISGSESDADMCVLRSTLLTPLLDTIVQSVTNTYNSLLHTSMAGLMYTTTHPVVLLRATVSAYTAMYGCTPQGTVVGSVHAYLEQTIAVCDNEQQSKQYMSPTTTTRITTPLHHTTTPNTTSTTPHKSILPTFTVAKTQLNPVLAHFLPGATAVQVRSAVKLVNHLPVFAFSTAEITQHAKRTGVKLNKPEIVFADSGGGTGMGSGGVKKVVNRVSALEKIDSDTMRVRQWAAACPIRVRYLIVAAFLAGSNPKESDNLKFVGGQEGRRKKQRVGTDHDVDISAAAGPKKSGAAALLLTSRYFSLERLISIYSQVVALITHKPALNYGDTALYASLRSLVEKGLLQLAPHWDLNKPFYLSCITFDTARAIADTMGFKLLDFMYNNSENHTM